MFGYHESDRCIFDLWSPVDAEGLPPHLPKDTPYPSWDPTRGCAQENRAFSPYAKHEQEIMDVADRIAAGETHFDLDDEWSEGDIAELNRYLRQRGIEASISLD